MMEKKKFPQHTSDESVSEILERKLSDNLATSLPISVEFISYKLAIVLISRLA